MFLHQPTSLWHILFNMLTLWCVGPVLERMMGHWPYLALYLLSGLGGGAGLMVWAVCSPSGWMTAAYGASGALFGLFAAILVVYRRIGIDIRSMLIWMLVNFLMPVITPGIAWQAHVADSSSAACLRGCWSPACMRSAAKAWRGAPRCTASRCSWRSSWDATPAIR